MGLFSGGGNFLKKAIDTGLSAIPGVGDYMAQSDANEANTKNARDQMQFQERMSNSAYQRGMEDMKKAGLNPMLAYKNGGASTPSGAAANIQPASLSKLGEFAMTGAQFKEQQKMNDNAIKKTDSDINAQNTQSAKNLAEAEKVRIDTIKAKKDLPTSEIKFDVMKGFQNFIKPITESLQNSAKLNAQPDNSAASKKRQEYLNQQWKKYKGN